MRMMLVARITMTSRLLNSRTSRRNKISLPSRIEEMTSQDKLRLAGRMRVTGQLSLLKPQSQSKKTGQTNPGQSSLSQISPDRSSLDLTNPGQTNPDLTNPGQTNPDLTNPGQNSLSQISPGQSSLDLTNPDQTNPDLTNPGQNSLSQISPGQSSLDLTNPGQTNRDLMSPGQSSLDLTSQNRTNRVPIKQGKISQSRIISQNPSNQGQNNPNQISLSHPIPPEVTVAILQSSLTPQSALQTNQLLHNTNQTFPRLHCQNLQTRSPKAIS